jgi:hypothetical protein
LQIVEEGQAIESRLRNALSEVQGHSLTWPQKCWQAIEVESIEWECPKLGCGEGKKTTCPFKNSIVQ